MSVPATTRRQLAFLALKVLEPLQIRELERWLPREHAGRNPVLEALIAAYKLGRQDAARAAAGDDPPPVA